LIRIHGILAFHEGDDMGKANQLNLGLICSKDIYEEVVKEVLNHQGILFKEIRDIHSDYEKFPCVILPRYTDEKYTMAMKYCEDEDNLIIAEKEIPLNFILNALGGKSPGSSTPSTDLLQPIINQHEIEFLTKIREKYYAQGLPLVRKWFWPNFFNACCIMTHDVDWLYYSPWHFAAIRNKSFPQLLKLAYNSLIHRRNYGNNIPEIITREKHEEIRSSFFFLIKYEGYHTEFLDVLKALRKEGFEIGLHGSGSSYKDAGLLKREKMKLGEYANAEIEGIRQHRLKFLIPFTWEYQEEAGFIYDTTLSYNNKFGFRSGICFPYHPINILKGRRFSILEILPAFMDWTVLFKKMSYNESIEIITKLEQVVEKFNGCLMMNFHNTYQNEETFPEICKLYSETLKDVKKRGYWVTTAKECCLWWLKREKTNIDLTLEDNIIKGKTSTYPLPIIIENTFGQKMKVNLQKARFKISLADRH